MKAPGCLNIRGPSVPLVRRKGVGVLWTYHADRALQERSHEFLKSWSWFLCSSLYLPHTPRLLLFTPPVLCLILQIIGLTNSLLGKERRAQTGCFADTFLALEQTFSPATRGDVKEKLAQKKPVGGTRGPNGPSPKRCVGGGGWNNTLCSTFLCVASRCDKNTADSLAQLHVVTVVALLWSVFKSGHADYNCITLPVSLLKVKSWLRKRT